LSAVASSLIKDSLEKWTPHRAGTRKNEVGHGKLVGRHQQPQKRLPRKVDAAPAPAKMRSAKENSSAVASCLEKWTPRRHPQKWTPLVFLSTKMMTALKNGRQQEM
jgi:hypothetical protein